MSEEEFDGEEGSLEEEAPEEEVSQGWVGVKLKE